MKVRLLLAGDAPGEPTVTWLNEAGHQLASAGERASLVIVDAAMGREGAAAACREAHAPVLALNARDADVPALIAAGADDFLPPPVTRGRLLARLALAEKRRSRAGDPGDANEWDDATYRAVLDGASDAVFVMERGSDRAWRTAYVNNAYLRLARRPIEEIIGKTAEDLLPAANARRSNQHYREAIRSRRTIEYEEVIELRHGKMVLSTHLTPLFDRRGKCNRLIGSSQDITDRRMAEEVLHANEERLHAIVEAAGDGIIVVDSRGIIESFNPAAEEMFGFEAIEVLGRSMSCLMPSPFSEEHDGYIARYLATGKRRVIGLRREAIARRADGSTFPIEISVSEMWIGGERKFTGMIRDITERKQAEERFRLLAEASTISNYVAQDGLFQYVNPQFERLTGYAAAELLGTSPLEIVHPADRDYVREQAVKMLKGELTGEYEFRILNKPGEIKWVMESVVSLDYHGRRATFGNYVDITERKLAEQRFETLAERSPIGTYIAQDGGFHYVNPQFELLTGYTAGEVLGTNPLDLVVEEDRETVRENAIRMLKGLDTGAYEYRIRSKAGDVRWIMENLVSLEYRGRRAGYGYYVDITERKEAEAKLRESEERYRATFQQLHDVLYKTDEAGVFTMISPSIRRLLGYAPEELMGQSAGAIYADPSEAKMMLDCLLAGRSFQDYEVELLRKDGLPVTVSLTASLVFGDGADRIAIQGTVRDITERKRVEEALRESEERYRTTFEQMHDIFYKTDARGCFTMVSPSCQKQAGFTPEELVGRHAETIYANPEDYRRFVDAILQDGLVNDAEVLMLRKDGSTIPVSLNGVLLRDADGRPAGIQGSVRDITERKQAEEERDRYFDLSTDMLAVCDLEARFVRVNPAWERVLGYPKEKMIGRTVMRFAHPDHRQKVIDDAMLTLVGQALNDTRTMFLTKDGETRWLSWNTSSVTGGVSYSVVRDVTDLVRTQEEQEEMMAILEENARILTEQAAELDALRTEAEYAANHDMLTGLLNRRAWFNVALSQRGTAVAIADIDHFKRINDTWGHPAGDAVLSEVSRRLEGVLAGATLGRVGGEEFAVFFSGSAADARETCERALAAVSASPIALPGGDEVLVTMSAGLAPWRRGRNTREDALARCYEEADAALYAAKQAGRARLIVTSRLRAA